MSAKNGLTINIAANVSEAVKGMDKTAESIEEVAEAIHDLTKEGRSTDQLERDFRDLQKETDRTSDAIKAKMADAYRSAGRSSDKFARTADDGFDKASRGVDDFKQEANSTLRETAASISSLEDGVGALQEVAANAFAGFGPVGAGAGLVAALGLGLVTAEITKQQEAAQRLRASFSEAYQEAADGGRKYLDAAQITQAANDLIFNPDRLAEYNKLKEDAIKLGIDDNQLILARAGDQEALNAVLQATAEKQQELKATTEDAGSNAIRLSLEERNNLEALQSDYEEIAQLHITNAENATKSQEIKSKLHAQEREQIKKSLDAERTRAETISELYRNPLEVKLSVDDSALRNYRPQKVIVATEFRTANGQLVR